MNKTAKNLKKIAVTGAAGFIGRHVLDALKKYPVEVAAVDYNGEALARLPNEVIKIEMDLKFPPADAFSALGSPDILIHLAWGGLPNYKSMHHLEVELPAHYDFLRNLVSEGLPGVLVTGTCFEYGMQNGCLREDMEPKPANPYAQAKDKLRLQLQMLQKDMPFELTWARLFYLYGKGQALNSLLPQLERAVTAEQDMFNMSGGEQLRDYLPIEKAAEYLAALAMKPNGCGVVNVCSGEPVSVRSLVELWINANSWKISLNLGYYPYPDYEPMEFWGDDAKLRGCIDNF